MGCWNKTCAISNLHITAGQRVAVFVLGEARYNNNFCYANSYFDPFLLPFYGEYNDYGAVEDCHGIGLNIVIDAIKNDLVELEQGSNPYHDIPASRETFDIEQLFDLDHKERLYIHEGSNILPNHDDKKIPGRKLTHVQIHGDIFDHIINNYQGEEYFYNKKNNFVKKSYKFRDVVNDLPELIKRLRKQLADIKGEGENLMLRWLARNITSTLFTREEGNLAARYLTFEMGPFFLVNPNDVVLNAALKMNDEELTELLTEILKGVWINVFMARTRRAWVKPVGEGSQNNETEGHLLLAQGVMKILKAEIDEQAEDDE